MFGFGLLSSAFDLLTFFVLLVPFHAGAALFQTSWFAESLLTELAVVAAMRTHKSLFRSLPSPLLILTSVAVAAVTLALPYLPLGSFFSFVPMPVAVLLAVLAIVVAYVGASELVKGRISVLGPVARPASHD
jgi:Mg2+-importing ATPase